MKHSSRSSLLKFPPQQSIGKKFYSKRKEIEILVNAEQIFHETFSNDFFNLMDFVLNSDSGINSNCDAIGIDFHHNNNVVSPEVCLLFFIYYQKNIETQFCFCFFVSLQVQIQEDKEDQLNFILPGCLLPFQKEIISLLFVEKQKFLRNKRFLDVFPKQV